MKKIIVAIAALVAAASQAGWAGAGAALGGYADTMNGGGSTRDERTVTAVWTGEQEYVTTVTGQSGWRCAYQVSGQRFYRIFRNGCPSTIQVQ